MALGICACAVYFDWINWFGGAVVFELDCGGWLAKRNDSWGNSYSVRGRWH